MKLSVLSEKGRLIFLVVPIEWKEQICPSNGTLPADQFGVILIELNQIEM